MMKYLAYHVSGFMGEVSCPVVCGVGLAVNCSISLTPSNWQGIAY